MKIHVESALLSPGARRLCQSFLVLTVANHREGLLILLALHTKSRVGWMGLTNAQGAVLRALWSSLVPRSPLGACCPARAPPVPARAPSPLRFRPPRYRPPLPPLVMLLAQEELCCCATTKLLVLTVANHREGLLILLALHTKSH